MTSPRHTFRYLQERFHQAGLRPESRYGQNFMIDQNLLDILVDAAELTKQDVVLEVGTGTGALTGRLAALAGHVVTVEIDARLQQLAAGELTGYDNITMLHADVLKNKNTIQPLVVQTVQEHMRARSDLVFKLVANPPYHIATPLISNLLLLPDPPERMVVTIQKELADRLLAMPSTKDYGSLSVWMQSFCEIELLRGLSPTVFWPRPKVHSAILRLTPRRGQLAARTDLQAFHRFVRSVFLLRRKYLRGVLMTLLKQQLEKSTIDEVMRSLDLSPQARAEELTIEQLDQLYQALQARLRESGAAF